MTPLLVTVLDHPVARDAIAATLAAVPAGRRDRVVVAWPGAAADPPCELFVAAKAAGFRRVRLAGDAGGLTDRALVAAADSGCDEVEVRLPGNAPWQALRALRAAGRLAFVTLSGPASAFPGRPAPDNPCAADEVAVDGDPSGLDLASASFRRVAVRGWPVCLAAGVTPDRVIANALVARGDPPALDLPTEDPGRCFFPPCPGCGLRLACDGLPWTALRDGGGRSVNVSAFGTGETFDAVLSPDGLAARVHPPTSIAGKVHLLGVLCGARPAGRVVVPPADAGRQVDLLRRLGLAAEVVGAGSVPPDLDQGSTREPRRAAHVFFARDPAAARACAEVETRFTAGGMDVATFGRRMGRLLGYPECCVEAFVAAGRLATTADLNRLAHGRTESFRWELDCLDPLSPVTVVPHIPCRFDCEPSLALARRVLAATPSVFPFLGGAARRLLGRTAFVYPGGEVAFADPPDSPLQRPGANATPFLAATIPALARGDAPGPGVLVFPFARDVAPHPARR